MAEITPFLFEMLQPTCRISIIYFLFIQNNGLFLIGSDPPTNSSKTNWCLPYLEGARNIPSIRLYTQYVVVQFYPCLIFIFFCFKLIIIYYHTQRQKEIKSKPRIKLNYNIYSQERITRLFSHGINGNEAASTKTVYS